MYIPTLGDAPLGQWEMLLPLALPLLQNMMGGGGAASAGGGVAAGAGTPGGGAAGGGLNIASLIGGLLKPQGGAAPMPPPPGAPPMPPPATSSTLTPEMVQQIVNAALAAKGVSGVAAAGPTNQGQCAPGAAYSTKHHICYDPHLYADEDAAFAALHQGLTSQSPLQTTPMAAMATAAAARGRAAARTGRASRSRSRSRRGLRGVSLNGLASALGAAETARGGWGNFLLVAGTAVLAAGAAWGLSRA